MKNNIGILIVLSLMLLTSCNSYMPISKARPQNNSTYTIDYLFEHEGIKVYRFKDEDRYVYFTNCAGEITSIKNDSTRTRTQTVK